MTFDYTIKYSSENTYENLVQEAFWQFMVMPESNSTQELVANSFKTSIDSRIEKSINGYGFETIRIHLKVPFDSIQFDAEFKLRKNYTDVLSHLPITPVSKDYQTLDSLNFKVENEPFLACTTLTKLSKKHQRIYEFDRSKAVVDNVKALNEWVHSHIKFKPNVTHIGTLLDDIIENRQGVCQDFSHLFLAIARYNGVPARYVSGYLHRGTGYVGASQMHAWVEAFVPNLGWVGFDPTNKLVANQNHIKVSHGKDYNDCAPLKGIIYSTGKNETKYVVEVTQQQ